MRKRFSNEAFLGCAQDYLPMDAAVHEVDLRGERAGRIPFDQLQENRFFMGDSDLADAISHAVEALAMEEAVGNLLAAFPTAQSIAPHREDYSLLAMTLEEVEVITAGAGKPRAIPRVKFHRDPTGALQGFRLVLYEGRGLQALSVCRQRNLGSAKEEPSYLVFYSFSPGIVRRFRRNLAGIVARRSSQLQEFTRLLAIERATRQISADFARQKQAMDQALRRLQLDCDRYGAGRFASDLEKELSRLSQWKTRLPKMLARATGNRP